MRQLTHGSHQRVTPTNSVEMLEIARWSLHRVMLSRSEQKTVV